MKGVRILTTLLLLTSLGFLVIGISAQEEQSAESAADVFKQTLEERGIEAAVTRFREMMADTSGAYAFDERELILAARGLAWEDKPDAAIELLKLLTEVYPESHWPWYDLGSQYLLAGDKEEAVRCLTKSLELNPNNAFVEWILANIDERVATARMQFEKRDMYAPGENTGIQGPYLGEEPPGSTLKVFSPGILNSTANEFSISFSPEGREIYFSRIGVGVMRCRWEEEGWTAPEPVRFFDEDRIVDEANVASDGQAIFFNARPTLGEQRVICRAERTDNGWGPPEELFQGMYATASLDGTLYYTTQGEPPDYGAIVRRRLADTGYGDPELLRGGINSESPDAHPFIAPDGSFILFDSYRDDMTGIYVCFSRADGTWGGAILLNECMSIPPFVGQCALTPDGKYLFFSLHGDMYWISAEPIYGLRPE